MEYLLLAALVIVSLTQPTITIASARRWRQSQEKHYADLRKKLVDDLAKAKGATESERRRLAMMQSELYLDTQMLQLACEELAQVRDEETDELMCDGNWKDVKKYLKDLAIQHNQEFNSEQEAQLREVYKVNVDPA